MADTLSNAIAEQITRYVKKGKRRHKVMLSLNREEILQLRAAADAAGVPVSTFARGAALLGTVAFLKSRGPDA
jgi:hypothetical protein